MLTSSPAMVRGACPSVWATGDSTTRAANARWICTASVGVTSHAWPSTMGHTIGVSGGAGMGRERSVRRGVSGGGGRLMAATG